MNREAVSMRSIAILGIVSLVFVAGCSGTAPNPHVINSPPTPSPPTPPLVPSELTVSPPTDTLGPAGARTFTANAAVTWAVLEGAAGGTITSTGTYTAPAAPGIYRVVATAAGDATKTATATVTVVHSGFTFAGSMMPARLGHTATLLPTGRVLIVGGGRGPDLIDGFFTIAEAEIFDPLTGTFISAGEMPRDFHTATLLRNGKVLIIGGETNGSGNVGDVTEKAEIYDPVTGLFQSTGSMATARESHTATLLADGRVLVTGGVRPAGLSWETLRTAELYDPAVGTFSPTGNMTRPRAFHSATSLPDGMVLVTGGADAGSDATAELYNPTTGSFAPTGGMAVARDNHTATLLSNGRVLVVGGSPRTATAEVYDPLTGQFELTGRMTTGPAWHTATLLPNGTVLIAGGYVVRGSSAETPTAEIYNPSTSSFTSTGSLGEGRFLHTATLLLDGRVLVTGGAASGDGVRITMVKSAEIYK